MTTEDPLRLRLHQKPNPSLLLLDSTLDLTYTLGKRVSFPSAPTRTRCAFSPRPLPHIHSYSVHLRQWRTELRIFDDLWRSMVNPTTGSILRWGDNSEPMPIHLHPNASLLSYNPSDRYTSSIFRVNVEVFRKFNPEEIRSIFRFRHILVYNVKHEEDWKWTRSTMEQICPLNALLECESMPRFSRDSTHH